MKKEAAI